MAPFERSLSKLSENQKFVEITYTEFVPELLIKRGHKNTSKQLAISTINTVETQIPQTKFINYERQ